MNMALLLVIGNDVTVMMAGQAGQLELNVMMPIIAYNLFQSMDIVINATNAFTEKCIVGIEANAEKATGWLAKNAILVTALNPVVGYQAGSALVSQALAQDVTIRELAVRKAQKGELIHIHDGRVISEEEIADVFENMRSLTEGGIILE